MTRFGIKEVIGDLEKSSETEWKGLGMNREMRSRVLVYGKVKCIHRVL